jgi:hypothetical protein
MFKNHPNRARAHFSRKPVCSVTFFHGLHPYLLWSLRQTGGGSIPVPDDSAVKAAIEQQAERVVHALGALNAARTPRERTRRERAAKDARAQLERQVSGLFGLSGDDAEIIESVPVPS